MVNKFDTDAMPVMTVAVSGRRDLREVTELARKRGQGAARNRFRGVGAVSLAGGRTRSINVTVDADKLAAFAPGDRRCSGRARAAEPRTARRADRSGVVASWSCGRLGRLNTASRVRRPDHHQHRRPADPDQETWARLRTRTRSPVPKPGSTARTPSACRSRSSREPTPSRWLTTSSSAWLEEIKASLAPRHRDRGHARSVAVHPEVDRGGQAPSGPRRGPGLVHDLAVHPRLANHGDRHARHPDVDHPHLSVHVVHGVHPEQHHDVGP